MDGLYCGFCGGDFVSICVGFQAQIVQAGHIFFVAYLAMADLILLK
jgi:hypothetical protein